MKIKKEWLATSMAAAAVIIAAIVAAVASLSNIGVAGADLNIRSGFFNTSVSMDDIGISLVENGQSVAERTYNSSAMNGSWSGTVEGELLSALPQKVVLNNAYDEALSVGNTGTINEYVRLTVYKYWLDPDGNKATDLSPELIEVKLADSSGWQEDKSAHTTERSVYYYGSLLNAGAVTGALTSSVTINNDVARELSQEADKNDPNTIITKYKYDGYTFVIEATADGVQENNAQEAIASAWGVNVSINEGAGTLTLN